MTTQTYDLVGAGGTGSLVYPPLLRYLDSYHTNRGENFIVAVIDGDHLEKKNLQRQMFHGQFIDENKADALVKIYGGPESRPIPEYLTEDNLEQRVMDGDIVLIAADNYDVRARLERRALDLDNIVLLNGGNEKTDGSLQIFIRKDGQNVTPPLSFQHPEILKPSPHDPSKLDCMTRAQVPGGEQTIIANMASASWLMAGLAIVHAFQNGEPIAWHELNFDLLTGRARSTDWRGLDGWQATTTPAVEVAA
jgi:molybdopterin/thiamine biosynthesis adenylyltransferase